MNTAEIFEKVMRESTQIALASLKTGNGADKASPNVRLMCYYYDLKTKKVYFCTFKGAIKIAEFEENKHVAFTTCPIEEDLAVRVEEAIVGPSLKSVTDVLEEIAKKLPLFNEIKSGDTGNIVAYEISFRKVHLHAGHNFVVDIENQ